MILWLAILATTFAAGWYSARKIDGASSAPQIKQVAANSKKGNAAAPTASELAKAKADLADALKVTGLARQLKLAEFVDGLDARMLLALLADFKGKKLYLDDQSAFDLMRDRLSEVDAKAAFARHQSLPDESKIYDYLIDIFSKWGGQNPKEALAAFAQLPKGEARRMALLGIFDNMDPATAFATLQNLPPESNGLPYNSVFIAWAKKDLAAATAAAMSLPVGQNRTQSLDGVGIAMAETDPSAALAWANTLPADPARNHVIGNVLVALSGKDPAAAATALLALPATTDEFNAIILGGFNRDDFLQSITTNWAKQDPSALLDWADKNLSGDTFNSTAQTALKQIGQTDPAAEAAAIAKLADPSIANESIPNLATAWAQQDVQAALAWAQTLPTTNEALRQKALNNVLSSWTDADPAGAAAFIEQNLTTDPDFGKIAAQAVSTWGKADPQAAYAWAQSLPAGEVQNAALVSAMGALANADPQAALADAQTLTGESHDQAMVKMIDVLSKQDPNAAMAAMATIPAGDEQVAGAASLAWHWLQWDPIAAYQWINTLPNGTTRDAAVRQVISTVGENDPGTAATWAATFSDPAARDTRVIQLTTDWAKKDPAAAATAAQNDLSNFTDLTLAQQKALQKIVAKAPVTH